MRVLIIEDDALNRRVIQAMFDIAGIVLDEAADVETGMEMIARSDYDAVLLDLRMPGKDGLVAMRDIRSRQDGKRNLPVIVITADAACDTRGQCLGLGATAVLTKPVAMPALFATLSNLMASVRSAA